MKILGFGNKDDIKKLLLANGYTLSTIRKVIVGRGYLDIFFLTDQEMIRLENPFVKLNKN